MANRGEIFEKLRKVFDLVVNNELATNCDDTLIEKLISFVIDESLPSKVDKEQMLNLLSLVEHAMQRCLEGDADVDVNVSLRLMGALLRHEHVFASQTCVVGSCLQIIANFLQSIATQHCNEYSTQAAYLNCIHNICSHKSGIQTVLALRDDTSLLITLFALCKRSESHFVRNACEKLLLKIVDETVGMESNETQIDALIRHIINEIHSSMNFLKLILSNEKIGNYLRTEHNLVEVLLSELDKDSDSTRIHVYCQCLGSIIRDQKAIRSLFEKLVNSNQLKGLVYFSSELSKRNKDYLKEWFLYSIYPLIVRSQLTHFEFDFDVSSREMEFVAKLTTKDIVKSCLFLISDTRNSPHFSEKQLEALLKTIALFVHENIEKKEMKKLVSEAISVLSQLPTIGIHEMESVQRNNQEFVKRELERSLQMLCIVFRNAKQSQKCEILKGIRIILNYFREYCLDKCTLIKDICCLIHEIFTEKIDDYVDQCDSALEVLYSLTQLDENLFLATYPDLLESFWKVWTVCSHNPCYSSLTALCLPILFDLDFVLSNAQLNVLQMSKHIDIILILTNYLQSDDLTLREAAIDVLSFRRNIPRLFNLCALDKQLFFQNIGRTLFSTAMFDVDFELQLNALKTLSLFVEKIAVNIEGDDELCDMLAMMHQNGFFDALYHTFNNNCVTLLLKEEAFRLKTLITRCFIARLGQQRFEEVINTRLIPKTIAEASVCSSERITNELNREEVLDQIFGDTNVPPTQTLLEELFNRTEDGSQHKSTDHKCDPIDSVTLIQFFNETHKLSTEDPVLCILDDILFSKAICNKTAVDCY